MPTTRARFSRNTGSAEAKIDRLDPAHPFAPARRRRQVLEFEVEFACQVFGRAPSLKARRAGTSRVRSVPGSRRAQPAGRTAAARRAPRFARRFWRTRASESSSSSARSAAPAPLARNLGAAFSSFSARRARSAREVDGARRRLGVGKDDARRLAAVGEVVDAARARSGAREQLPRRAREGERPIQPLSEHGVGEPGRAAPRPPLPGPSGDGRPRRGQSAPRQGESARGGERRRPGAGDAGLGRLERLFQRFVVRNPENLGGGGKRGPPLPGRAGGELPPGEKDLSCGSGIAAPPAEMERVAQGGLVFGAAGAAHAGGGGAQRQALAQNAGPGRVFADDGVEAGERRAGEKGGFGFRFGRVDRPRPGRERRRRGGRKALDCLRISAREHAETLLHRRRFWLAWRAKPPGLSTRKICPIRLHYRTLCSLYKKAARIARQSPQNDPQYGSRSPRLNSAGSEPGNGLGVQISTNCAMEVDYSQSGTLRLVALSIKDPETERLARALAERTGESLTIATRRALEERLRRMGTEARKAALLEDLAASRRRWRALPVLDPRGADDILGYDDNGLPR